MVMGDILFSSIEKMNAMRCWGRFLDAGTGVHSLKWIQKLPTTEWVAITADNNMKAQITNDKDIKMRSNDKLVVGNWMDESFCKSLGKYDTILADYLIGAVDGFSPYYQDVIVSKLKEHLSPGGRLYVVGMNPIPDSAQGAANIVTEVRRARDSCILLAGHRPYREYPMDWMVRHLEKADFTVSSSKSYSILHSEDSILRQMKVGQSKLHMFPNAALRQGMEAYMADLTVRVKAATKTTETGRLPLSSDYVIEARARSDDEEEPNSPGRVTGLEGSAELLVLLDNSEAGSEAGTGDTKKE